MIIYSYKYVVLIFTLKFPLCSLRQPTNPPAGWLLFSQLIETFGLRVSSCHELYFSLGDFALLPGSRITVLRDGDQVCIERLATVVEAAAVLNCATPLHSPLRRLPGSTSAGQVVHASASRRTADAAPGAEQRKRIRSKDGAGEPAPGKRLCRAAGQPPPRPFESPKSSSTATVSGTSSDSAAPGPGTAVPNQKQQNGGAAASVKPSSRSARRKAAKRRLRRLDLLVPGGKQPTSAAPAPAAAAPSGKAIFLYIQVFITTIHFIIMDLNQDLFNTDITMNIKGMFPCKFSSNIATQ